MFYYREPGLLRCAALEQKGVVHGFSTRLGGVSEGFYFGMNLGYNRGDPRETVDRNYSLLGKYLGLSLSNLTYVRQIHSDIVHILRADRACLYADGDALITDLPEMPIACYYADCMPVLLYDKKKRAVAAVHSGWRGTALNIIGRTLEEMGREYGVDPKDVTAAVGPSIGPCHMEVGPEVIERFENAGYPVGEKRSGTWYLDLWEAARMQLSRAGVCGENIHIARICTACHPELYFSHRAMGEKRGNHCAVIALTE